MSHQPIVYQVLIGSLGSLSSVLNAVGIFVLFKIPFKVYSTTVLFRFCLLTGFYSSLILVISNLLPEHPSSTSLTVNRLICKLWYRDAAFWHGISLNILSLVSISLDRLLVVLYFTAYQGFKKRFAIASMITILTLSLGLTIPLMFRRDYSSGKCFEYDTEWLTYLIPTMWILLNYILPLLFLVGTYAYMLFVIKYRRAVKRGISEVIHRNCDGQNGNGQSTSTREYQRLLVNTGLMAGNFGTLGTAAVLLHAMRQFHIITSNVHTYQSASIILSVFLCLTPVIMIFSTERLRSYILTKFNWRILNARKK